MRGKLIRNIIIAVLLVYAIGLLSWWIRFPPGLIVVAIPKGASAHKAAQILYEEKIISSPGLFLNIVKFTGKTKKLKAGTYELSRRYSIFKVINILASGKSKYIRVTIPEGFDSREIAGRLAEEGIVNREAFLKIVDERKLEGYLFPETYYFEKNTPEETVINAMISEFDKNYTPQMKERANKMKKLDEKKVIILASIIEREAVVSGERPLISAVFYNRIKKRMYLESCATILYALGKHKEKLTYADLEVNSPYNTYKHFGLPPGPICSPGLASINAALYPAETDALYFVVKSSGTHTFSTRFEDHLKEKIKRKKNLRKIKKKQ